MRTVLIGRLVLNLAVLCAVDQYGTPEPDNDPLIVTAVRRMYATVLYGFIEVALHWAAHQKVGGISSHRDHHAHPTELSFMTVREDIYAYLALILVLLSYVGAIYSATAMWVVMWYSAYEVFHMVQHLRTDRVPRQAAEWHRVQHHDHPTTRFGVTTRGWDRLFNVGDGEAPTVLDFIPIAGWYLDDWSVSMRLIRQ